MNTLDGWEIAGRIQPREVRSDALLSLPTTGPAAKVRAFSDSLIRGAAALTKEQIRVGVVGCRRIRGSRLDGAASS